jgi:starch phosphorylase
VVAARDEDGLMRDVRVLPMRRDAKAPQDGLLHYRIRLAPDTSGSFVYGVRVVPQHEGLAHPYGMGLARWA